MGFDHELIFNWINELCAVLEAEFPGCIISKQTEKESVYAAAGVWFRFGAVLVFYSTDNQMFQVGDVVAFPILSQGLSSPWELLGRLCNPDILDVTLKYCRSQLDRDHELVLDTV